MIEVEVEGGFGGFVLDVVFRSPAGITALFGHSGAGKTTLVAMIGGLLRPRRGRIALNGRVLFDAARGIDLPARRRRIGHVFQEGRLFPHFSAGGNLLYGARLAPVPPSKARIGEVVALLGVGPLLKRRPNSLSGGEAQRIAIGRALLSQPDALVLDEPLAGLDHARKQEILPYLEGLRTQAGLPILYVSHAIDEVARLARDMVLLSGGRVAATGPVETVLGRLDLRPMTGRFEAGSILEGRLAAHDPEDHLSEVALGGQRLVLPLVDAPLGATVRLRVRARDVALALSRPEGISIQNVLKGRIADLRTAGPGLVELNLLVEGQTLSARLTVRAARALDLKPGLEAFALVKTMALDRSGIAAR
ncbi:MAG: molybdenum ABC transporter ATP-binding protein [Geminicoccaceae bacterium]|nr:molybdenum ABC transporter ATP-binding protein [Geminicoccaceae bacterium]